MAVAPPFIPQPIPDSANPFFARQVAKLLGQTPLRSSVTLTALGGGDVRVAAQVRSCVGEPCTGFYRLHIFAAATAGGAVLAQADVVTTQAGLAEVDLSAGAGSVVVHVAVLGVYEAKEVVLT